MKLKGVNFFEAHVEKILLGAMVAVAAGVVAMQFVIEPNTVQIENREYRPQEVFEPAKELAERSEGRMTQPDVELPDAQGRMDVLDGIEARVTGGVAVRPTIAALGEVTAIEVSGQAAGEDVRYVEVTPPAPSRPIAETYAGTLDPYDVLASEELAALVGDEQPYDLAMVSVEATYDGVALEAAFRDDPDGVGGELRPLPLNWWASVEAFGLQLERQELQPDGSWSDIVVIEGMPGGTNLMADLRAEVADGTLTREQLAADARGAYEFAADYRRPQPYRMIAGEAWVAPTQLRERMAQRRSATDEVQRLSRENATLKRRIENFDERITEERQSSSARGGGDRQAAEPRGRGTRRPPRDPGDADDEDDPAVRRLVEQKEQLEARLAENEEEIRRLGFDPETGLAIERIAEEEPDERLLRETAARMWAHDVTARAGATYRYRTRLAINNPAFGRDSVLIDEQKAMAESPILLSEASPWSDPVQVAPKTAFFVVSANDGNAVGLGPSEPSATLEAFVFYYGYYRRGTVTLRPGELLAGRARMPDDLSFVLVDADAAEGDDQFDARGVGASGLPGQQGGEEGEPVPDEVPIQLDVLLVDVTTEAVRGEGLVERTTQPIAYFSFLDGPPIVRRQVGSERQGRLYARLTSSAEEGTRQGQPLAVELPPDPVDRGRDRDRDRDPGGFDPKGGGGGGGG
ncbi:MAG: hypothetical protein AAFX79_05985 [Planctomycetota bacterium]